MTSAKTAIEVHGVIGNKECKCGALGGAFAPDFAKAMLERIDSIHGLKWFRTDFLQIGRPHGAVWNRVDDCNRHSSEIRDMENADIKAAANKATTEGNLMPGKFYCQILATSGYKSNFESLEMILIFSHKAVEIIYRSNGSLWFSCISRP